jgi:DNA polymerase III delta prime subunit
MSDYDFHQLTHHDLEILVRDLLQAHWGITLESFKAGRDRGIDLRYARGDHNTIVQVKHYLRTGLDGLLQEVKKEAVKVRALTPKRYVFVTTVPLSPDDKDRIVELIGPEFLALDDVLGPDELNNLLGQHPKIEIQHFKLWLASTAVLQAVLNNAEVTRSKFKVRQVYEQARRYVMSDAYHRALVKLNEERIVIVAGPPGVGKTTLADLLLYQHLENGYQAVVIQRDVVEGEKLFLEGEMQVFYFDDFMGATFLGEGAKLSAAPNDQALLNFIEMVRQTPSARLILTTREHIYAQALERSEKLRNSNLDDARVFLHMPAYSFEQRARILYNHLYFSDLPDEFIAELMRGDFYLKIAKHERFNPRLIEWLSSYKRVQHVSVADYQKFVEGLLRDPSEIWRHAYERELSDAGRSLLLAIYSLEGKASGIRLGRAFNAIHSARATRYGFATRPEDFRLAMREAANMFIKPMGQDGFEVIDPSVLDLMNAVFRGTPENAVDVLVSSGSFPQVERVWLVARSQQGGTVVQAIRDSATRIGTRVRALALAERRVEGPDGSYGMLAPSYERRLETVIDMFERTGATPFLEIIDPLFKLIQQAWVSKPPDINECVELMRTLELSTNIPAAEAMLTTTRSALISEAQTGCRADELRELITVINTSSEMTADAIAARVAFEKFRDESFSEDLSNCRSTAEFDGLVEDLEFMRDELRVDIQPMIDRVEEAKIEHQEGEDAYADHMQDEWKERGAQDRASDRAVSDMFGSLKGRS